MSADVDQWKQSRRNGWAWLQSTPVIVLSGIIGWSIATGLNVFDRFLETKAYDLDVARERLAIVSYVDGKNITLATLMIDYYGEILATGDPSYTAFLTGLRNYLASPAANVGEPTVAEIKQASLTLDAETIRSRMNAPDRRDYAESLVAAYEQDASKGPDIVDGLLQAILADGSTRQYRVNIYIALTFSLLPKGAIRSAEQYETLSQLEDSQEYKGDSQFRVNVKAALAKQEIQ